MITGGVHVVLSDKSGLSVLRRDCLLIRGLGTSPVESVLTICVLIRVRTVRIIFSVYQIFFVQYAPQSTSQHDFHHCVSGRHRIQQNIILVPCRH